MYKNLQKKSYEKQEDSDSVSFEEKDESSKMKESLNYLEKAKKKFGIIYSPEFDSESSGEVSDDLILQIPVPFGAKEDLMSTQKKRDFFIEAL